MLDTVISPGRTALNDQQFGATAALYVQSPVHSGGPDLEQIRDIVARRPDANVLDLGCGGGHVSYFVAPVARAVTACDPAAEMVSAVSAEAARRGLANVTTEHAPAEKLPFDDASFDVVVARHTTHHWPDVRRGIREAARVVKPGGVVVAAWSQTNARGATDPAIAYKITRRACVIHVGIAPHYGVLPTFGTFGVDFAGDFYRVWKNAFDFGRLNCRENSIPTLSEWALAALALAIAAFAFASRRSFR